MYTQFEPEVLPSMTLAELAIYKGKRPSLRELKALPTLEKGHFDDLKIETPINRVWLSRLTVDDGTKYNNRVIVEQLINGAWSIVREYQAR